MNETLHPIELSEPAGRARVHHLSPSVAAPDGVVSTFNIPDSLLAERNSIAAVLETIFCQCQNVEGHWLLNSGIQARSLSVGDVIELDSETYVVENTGFSKVPYWLAVWLLTSVTVRDFWSDVVSTMEHNTVPRSVTRALSKEPIMRL